MTPRLDKKTEAAIKRLGRTRQNLLGHKTALILPIEELMPLVDADDAALNALRSRIADISLTPEEAQAVVYYLDYYNVAEEIVHRLPVNTALGKLRTLAAASPSLSSDTTK